MIIPYSKTTTVEFWTDPYISKKLLDAHLDPNTDAASRKPFTIRQTVKFIETIVTKDKTIADFGCGPGLYTDKLQRRGYTVTGIDVSERSLEYARSQNKYVQYKYMNYVERPLPIKVDFIQMIYCDFGALSPYAQKHTLSNVKQSLKYNGLFFFDVCSEHHFIDEEEYDIHELQTDGFYQEGTVEVKTENIKIDNLKLIMRHVEILGEETKNFYFYDKCYSKKEIEELLVENGFEVVDIYSDTTGSKHFDGNKTYTVLCKVNYENW